MSRILVLALLLFAAPVLPQPFERTAGVVGILPLPEVFGAEACERFTPRDMLIFRSPAAARPFGRIHVAKQWTHLKEGGCEGLEVRVGIAEPIADGGRLPTMEYAYEQPGAIALRQINSWFEIALDKGTGWVRVNDPVRFLPVEKLLKDGLPYLRKGAPIRLHTRPGDPAATPAPGTLAPTEMAVQVRGFRRVGGRLWVQVELLSASPCAQEKMPPGSVSGWMPFHTANGEPSVWFYSRGC